LHLLENSYFVKDLSKMEDLTKKARVFIIAEIGGGFDRHLMG
jgi:hypothetical protein